MLACLLGAGLGLLYDAFRMLRIILPHHKIVIFLEDLLFCTAAILLSFAFVISMGNGVLRGFMVFGELMGAILYFFTLGLAITGIANKVKSWVRHIIFLFKKKKPLEFAGKDSV